MEEEDTVQRSLQQELAHLKETLHELNSELCLESDSSGKSHPYSTLNLAEKKSDMMATLQRAKALFTNYKKWAEEDPSIVRQTLIKTKEIQEQKVTLNKLQTTINNCQLLGTRYLEETNRLPVKKETTYNRVQMVTEKLRGLTFYGNEMEETGPFYIGTETAMITFNRNEEGRVDGVEFMVGDTREEILSQQLLEALQTFHFLDFEKLLASATARYIHRDALQKQYKDFALNAAINVMEEDVRKIHQHELTFFSREECLREKTGIVTKQCSGYWISFAEIKTERNREKKTLSEDPLVNMLHDTPDTTTYSGLLRLEQSSKPTMLSAVSAIAMLDDDGRKMDMNALDAAIGPVPLNFMLLLEPSVVITITSLYEIFGVTGSHKPMSGNQDIKVRFSNTTEVPAAGVPITHLLLGSDITTTPQLINGHEHKYTNNSHGYGSVLVRRIPFVELEHLAPILQILRQQVTFNELVTSCFLETRRRDYSRKRKYNYDQELTEKVTFDIEIDFIAPSSINLKFGIDDNLFEFGLRIPKNGKIHCTLNSEPASAAVKYDITEITKDLNTTHDIPKTLEKFWCAGIEPMAVEH